MSLDADCKGGTPERAGSRRARFGCQQEKIKKEGFCRNSGTKREKARRSKYPRIMSGSRFLLGDQQKRGSRREAKKQYKGGKTQRTPDCTQKSGRLKSGGQERMGTARERNLY